LQNLKEFKDLIKNGGEITPTQGSIVYNRLRTGLCRVALSHRCASWLSYNWV